MIRFVFSPEWFYGIDSIFEIFSVIVTLIIAGYAYKLYKFSENKNYKYFSLAFLLFAVGFIFKILTNITVYSEVLEKMPLGTITLVHSTIHQYEFFYILGYLGFRLAILLGLLGIYMVSYKHTNITDMFLYSFLFILICIFSHYDFIIFHLTTIAFLCFIVYFYINNYLNKKNKPSLLIASSFIFLLISQVFFAFTYFELIHYITAEIFQLIGFILLLIGFMWVIKK